MQKFIAKADKKTSSSVNKYSVFVGRWQPWHKGHRWLIDQRLNKGKNVLICIRDVFVDEKNPFLPKKVERDLKKEFSILIKEGRIKIMIIPDIESINYGRGVGYDIIEHKPPKRISFVSATKIREKMKKK